MPLSPGQGLVMQLVQVKNLKRININNISNMAVQYSVEANLQFRRTSTIWPGINIRNILNLMQNTLSVLLFSVLKFL